MITRFLIIRGGALQPTDAPIEKGSKPGMSDHYQHQQAVAAARAELQEYRNRLAHAAEKAEEVLALINNAVGDQHLIESARNGFELTAASQERVHEAMQAATQADFELERYQGGF